MPNPTLCGLCLTVVPFLARLLVLILLGLLPPFKRMYRLSPSELQEVKRQVTELLQKQLIEPSVRPFVAPLLFVLKKGGDLVIDYRAPKPSVTKGYHMMYVRLLGPQTLQCWHGQSSSTRCKVSV